MLTGKEVTEKKLQKLGIQSPESFLMGIGDSALQEMATEKNGDKSSNMNLIRLL